MTEEEKDAKIKELIKELKISASNMVDSIRIFCTVSDMLIKFNAEEETVKFEIMYDMITHVSTLRTVANNMEREFSQIEI